MPMVAGWDRMIPEWFARLHARFRTPVNSILFIGVCALVFAVAGMTGVGEQEGFQLLQSSAGILYGFSYLVLFAVPIAGLARTGQRAPLWIRITAGVGFATTALYVVLAVLPIVPVKSERSFALKTGGTVVVTVVIGVALYLLARWRNRRPAPPRD
jgi:amino acid transporter